MIRRIAFAVLLLPASAAAEAPLGFVGRAQNLYAPVFTPDTVNKPSAPMIDVSRLGQPGVAGPDAQGRLTAPVLGVNSVLDGALTPTLLMSGGMDASAAIAAAWVKGGAHLPCGTYRLDAPLVAPASNTALLGDAAGCTRILVNFAVGDVISLTSLSNVRIEGIQFIAQGVRTSGAVIHVTGGSNNTVANLRADGGGGQWADVVVIDGGAIANMIQNFYFSGASGDCVRLAGYALDTFIRNGNATACGTGIHLRSVSGAYLGDMDLVGSVGNGILIDPVAGDSVDAVRGGNVLCDTSAGVGIMVTGVGYVTELDLTNVWVGASGTSGVFTAGQVLNMPMAGIVLDNPAINGVQLTALRAKGNGAEGIDVRQGKNISLIGPHTLMNGASFGTVPPGGGAASTTRYAGIRIRGGADYFSVNAPISGAGGWEQRAGLAPKQSYGLVREAGTAARTGIIFGGMWPGNVTGSYQINRATGDSILDTGNQP